MFSTNPWHTYKKLFDDVTPPAGVLIIIVLLMVVETAISLTSPWLAGRFTDSLLSPSPALKLSSKQLLVIWLLILAIKGILSFFNSYFTGKTSQKMLTKMRVKLYDHLQMLPISYYHDKKHGKILAFLTNDATIISTFVTSTLVRLIPIVITICGALVCIYFINPVAAILAALLIPIFYIISKLLGRSIRGLSKSMIEQYSKTLAIADENLATLPLIKSFTREGNESRKFSNSSNRLLELTTNYLKIQSFLGPLTRFLATLIIFIILWFLSNQLATGELGAADMVSLILYGMLITQPISGLADLYGQVQHTIGATERLSQLFSNLTEQTKTGVVFSKSRGEIEFTDVVFCYPGCDNTLTQLNLKIEAGETVAITGKNGAGKSTLIHLLMRFIEPQQGIIRFDANNIQELSLSSLRQQIGLVQQQVFLQNNTVAENILFGKTGASFEEIEQAARQAHASDFIRKLPYGYDTVIGDQGVKLSGGQKQRLALARVLLKDPAVLILDEATAMFDPAGETAFIEECKQLLQKKTVIIISHRPASLALADTLYRLEDGKLFTIN